MASLTPTYNQYTQLKAQHPDVVLIMEIGDFFEAFDDDAQVLSDDASQIVMTLDIGGEKIKMAGFPVHMSERYIKMLVKAGHRVAIARRPSQ